METNEKKTIIEKFAKSEKDTGSVYVQVALLTRKIEELTEHLKIHKNDKSSYRGLRKKVGKRKSFLKYLSERNIEEYRKLIKELGLRK